MTVQTGSQSGSDAVLGTMARLMPFVVSLFLHLSIILVCMFLTMVVVRTKAVATEVPPPQAFLSTEPQIKVLPPTAHPEARIDKRGSKFDSTVPREMDPAKGSAIVPDSIAGTGSSVQIPGLNGGGPTVCPGSFPRGDGGGVFIPRCGDGVPARHIVYLVDISGSMSERFDTVRNEMIKSISDLKDTQDLHVIFFADGPLVESGPQKLVSATMENKKAVAEFLETIRPASKTGQTFGAPAIARAFDVLQKADKGGKLIFLLTDGVFSDSERLYNESKSRNVKGEIHISTLLCGDQAPAAKAFMQKVAKDNGGEYKYVSLEE